MKNNLKKHKWNKVQVESAQTPNFAKKYIIKPELIKLIGNVENKKILELGSGNGYWLELLSKRGAICTGVEISEKQLELAKKNNSSVKYIKGDITTLNKYKFKKNFYDLILIQHVLLEIASLKKIEKIMKESFKLLKKSGIIIITDIHPFAPSANTTKIRVQPSYNYFSSGEMIEIISKRIDGKETIYRDYHWTLSNITDVLTNSGFHIIKLAEPRPSLKLAKKYPELEHRLTIPMAFWIKGIKP